MYVSVNWVNIGSANGLLPVRHWAITWINAGVLLNGPYHIKFGDIWVKMQQFLLRKHIRKCHLPLCSAWSLNVPGLSLNKISRLQRPWWHFWQSRAAVQGPLLALVLLNFPGKTNRYLHFQSFLSYWDSKVVETCTYGEQRLLRPAYHSC